ncbi:nucleotidyltransferase family protein [Microcoleus sp. FACHB-53]|nr:nucleotidyltransferase family protein [Microcoleus sp. FACHB-53]
MCCKQQRFAIALLNLPNWWLAGGAVRNTVWRSLFGNDCQLVINDFDIAFFDALGDRSQELTAKATLTAQFPDYKFDQPTPAPIHNPDAQSKAASFLQKCPCLRLA